MCAFVACLSNAVIILVIIKNCKTAVTDIIMWDSLVMVMVMVMVQVKVKVKAMMLNVNWVPSKINSCIKSRYDIPI